MNIYEKLMNIQNKLKAPKDQFNSFGGYTYRTCEDILEVLKPLLVENKATVTLKDEMKLIGDRYYLESTATLIDIEKGDKIEVTALAREPETKKGMDLAQITGSVSSYARKYALNGLFAIDDTKDSDVTNTHGKSNDKSENNTYKSSFGGLTQPQLKRLYAIANSCGYDKAKIETMISGKYGKEPKNLTKQEYDHVCEGLQAKLDASGE